MTSRPPRSAALLAIAALAASLAAAAPSADAAVKHYRNCTALNKVYPHGVGKTGAKDKTTGKRVTNFKVSTTIYNANNGPRNLKTGEYDLDRDNDGIACEKR
jgi:uncharacterized membrane protein